MRCWTASPSSTCCAFPCGDHDVALGDAPRLPAFAGRWDACCDGACRMQTSRPGLPVPPERHTPQTVTDRGACGASSRTCAARDIAMSNRSSSSASARSRAGARPRRPHRRRAERQHAVPRRRVAGTRCRKCSAAACRGQRDRALPARPLPAPGVPMSPGNVYLCDGIRTPFGRYRGGLCGIRTDDLAALRSGTCSNAIPRSIPGPSRTCCSAARTRPARTIAMLRAWPRCSPGCHRRCRA